MINPGERRWLLGFLVMVIIITTLPYLIGYSRQGEDWRFTGMLFGVEDGNSYIAKMLRGAEGEWLFRTPYSPYPQRGAFVQFSFTLLGKFTAEPGQHEQLVGLYHLFRIASVFLYGWAAYQFIAVFLSDIRWRRLGTALAMLGGGLGWLHVVGLSGLWNEGTPLEFYSPETFGFLMVYGLPHLACARAFLLWGLRDYLCADKPLLEWKSVLRTIFLWLGLGIMQPLTVVVGWAVIGVHIITSGLWQLWRGRPGNLVDWVGWRRNLLRALRVGLLSAPIVIYTFVVFQMDPFLNAWQSQNRILSPVIWHYLLAYGLFLPVAVLGARALLREMGGNGWLLIGWVAIFPLLAYAPYPLQRRLPEGVWVALIILVLKYIEMGSISIQKWARVWAAPSFFPTFILLAGGIMAAWLPHPPAFVPVDAVQAFQFLRQYEAKVDKGGSAVVLASFELSNALPAWAPTFMVTGHGPEGVNGKELKQNVRCFYDEACSNLDREAWLNELDVHYVFWGPDERKLGHWDPRGANYLDEIYQQGEYAIFAVKEEK